MSIFNEIPPTAGIPLKSTDFLEWSKIFKPVDYLQEDFKKYLEINYLRITCSGTVALYLILEAVKELTNRRVVIVPSFICPLVALAIQRSGFIVRVCDIEKDNFNYDLRQLEAICEQTEMGKKGNPELLIAAVIVDHLAGIPLDINKIAEVVKKYNIFIIEDVAQSLGALYQGKKVGTIGDFSFFSMSCGKGVTTYEGGAVATKHSEYGKILDNKIKKNINNNFSLELIRIIQLLGLGVFYRPALFWWVYRLPQIWWHLRKDLLKAAMEDFELNFPMHEMSSCRKLLGHAAFKRLDFEINRQRKRAEYYFQELNDFKGTFAGKGIQIIRERNLDMATFPYVTIILPTPEDRRRVLYRSLGRTTLGGDGISTIYARALPDYPYLKGIISREDATHRASNARFLVERIVTLSTSIFLNEKKQNKILKLLSN